MGPLQRISNFITGRGASSVAEPGERRIGSAEFQPHTEFSIATGGRGSPPVPDAADGIKTYKKNPYVKAAFDAIVYDAAFIPLIVRRKIMGKNGIEYERIYEHQALDLLNSPLPKGAYSGRTFMTAGQLRQVTFLHLLGAGESFWKLGGHYGATSNYMGTPTEIRIRYPSCMSVVNDPVDEDIIKSYVYRKNNMEIRYTPEEIVHFKLIDPENYQRGASNLSAVGKTVDNNEEADSYLWWWFKNRAIPDLLLMLKGEPNKEEIERFYEQWNARFRGAKNNGKPGLVWNAEQAIQMNQDLRSMQFREMQDHYRDAIFTSQRVGKGVAGQTEDQSRANADAQDYAMAKRVIRPFMQMFCEQLTADFLPTIDESEDVEIWFEDPVQDDVVSKSQVWSALLDRGAVTLNETRREFGMDAFDDPMADTLLVGAGKVPIADLSLPPDPLPPFPPDNPDEDPNDDPPA